MKNFLSLGFLFTILTIFGLASCNSDKSGSIVNTKEIDNTRSLSTKALAKEYNYKSLASFKKGEILNNMKLSDLGNFEGKNVNLVVLYDTEAPWANVFSTGNVAKTGDDKFNALLSMYNLAIIKQFELDEMNEGLVIEPNGPATNVVEIAREISMIDYVLMVHVKEIPADKVEETADND